MLVGGHNPQTLIYQGLTMLVGGLILVGGGNACKMAETHVIRDIQGIVLEVLCCYQLQVMGCLPPRSSEVLVKEFMAGVLMRWLGRTGSNGPMCRRGEL